ncbi:MAG: hypothetical protein Q8M88_16630 [Phenylobacterium sp.]|uniref:hypothetical protein n=1 Tax=Phenylobacterium sp. TaxID=1871053 RepID=UPI002734D303|nr:hypothetical protein [Phenylobacterium sp.]MDP3176056.1 hypothetical protein [Phenylobacterium sp.]
MNYRSTCLAVAVVAMSAATAVRAQHSAPTPAAEAPTAQAAQVDTAALIDNAAAPDAAKADMVDKMGAETATVLTSSARAGRSDWLSDESRAVAHPSTAADVAPLPRAMSKAQVRDQVAFLYR